MKHMGFIVKEGINNFPASFGNALPFYGSKILYFLRAFAKLPLTEHGKSSSIFSSVGVSQFAFLSAATSLFSNPSLLSLTPPSSLFLVSLFLFLKVSFSLPSTPSPPVCLSSAPHASGPSREETPNFTIRGGGNPTLFVCSGV